LVGADAIGADNQRCDERESADSDNASPESPIASAHEERGRNEERELRLEDQCAKGEARQKRPVAAKQRV